MKTVAALFPSLKEADRAYEKLQEIGTPRESISVIAGNDDKRHDEYLNAARRASVGDGKAALSDASIGGGVGIVAMLIALAIPGVGPIVALGPLLTVVVGLGVGAAAGGIIGALHNMGISREEAPLYEEAVRRGAVIVAATVDEQFEEEAVDALKQIGGRDVRDEADTWEHAGWSGPAHDPHPYVLDSTKRTRSI